MPEKYDKPRFVRQSNFKPPISLDDLREIDLAVKGDPIVRKLLWEIYRLRAVIVDMEKLVHADAEILAKMQELLKKGPEG